MLLSSIPYRVCGYFVTTCGFDPNHHCSFPKLPVTEHGYRNLQPHPSQKNISVTGGYSLTTTLRIFQGHICMGIGK